VKVICLPRKNQRVTRLTISVAVWKRIAAAQGPMGEVASAALTGSSSATAAIKFTNIADVAPASRNCITLLLEPRV